jgi:hypothetical protein
MRVLAAVLFLAACGGSSSKKAGDAPPDMPPDLAPLPDTPPGHFFYVVDHEDVPTNNTQARAYGLDLNNDGTVDNQFGMVLATLSGMGFDPQTSVTNSITSGKTILLADLYALDFANTTGATFTTYDGDSVSVTPPTYKVASTSPHDTPLAGTAAGGTFNLGPGQLELQGAYFVPDQVVKLHLIGARTKLTAASANGLGPSILAGAIPMSEITGTLEPGWQASAMEAVLRDCCGAATSPGGATCNPNGTPACGCTDGSEGKTMLGLFDNSPKDCTISLTEIQNNSLIMSLLAPDVTIDGQMALSFGVQVTAKRADLY